MWVAIKQVLLILGFGRILLLLALLMFFAAILKVVDASNLMIQTNYGLIAIIASLTLLSLFDDLEGLKRYLHHLGNEQNLEWRIHVNGFLFPLREPLHEILKPYCRALNANQDALKEMAFSSAELAINARSYSKSAADQSAATTSSAAAITEMSYSLEDISQRIKSTRDRATKALQLTEKGSAALQEANAEVAQVAALAKDTEQRITTLDELMHSVTSMSRIISEIAEQTNLLALNAAIEAARAGEYGRGFAVVAASQQSVAVREISGHVEMVASHAHDSSQRATQAAEIAEHLHRLTRQAEL